MIEFVCDNPDIRKILEKLGEALVRSGAYFHPDLKVVCQNNNFSMHNVRPVNNQDMVVHIPSECFINVDDFSFAAQNNKIFIKSINEQVSVFSQELMAFVIELYNLSGKLEQFTNASIYNLYYEDRGLYNALTKGIYLLANKYFGQMSKDEVFLKNFIDQRVLNVRGPQGAENRFLVPFIEYFNHDKYASCPQIVDTQGVKKVRGFAAHAYLRSPNDELFINYGANMNSDARTLLVYEGFLDGSIEVVKSLPLEFNIENIKIAVHTNFVGATLEEMPAGMADLSGYCPQFDTRVENTIQFSFLYIPDQDAPRSLIRILFYGINALVKDKGKAIRLTQLVEHKIISKNLEYYEDLKDQLDHFRPSAGTEEFIKSAREMVKLQLSIIENYRSLERAGGAGLKWGLRLG